MEMCSVKSAHYRFHLLGKKSTQRQNRGLVVGEDIHIVGRSF